MGMVMGMIVVMGMGCDVTCVGWLVPGSPLGKPRLVRPLP